MCGLFGIYAPGKDVAKLTYLGLYSLQHRGQESAGIAVSNGNELKIHKALGLVSQIFNTDILSQLKGDLAIGHTRYSTTGSHKVVQNAHPMAFTFRGEEFVLAHNGNLVNADDLNQELTQAGFKLQGSSDTELIGHLITRFQEFSFEEALIATTKKLQGAFTLLLMTKDTLYGLRDPNGIRPLLIGKQDGDYMLASEDPAFAIVNGETIRDVAPGEMVKIGRNGLETRFYDQSSVRHICVFEYIYFARPDSHLEGRNLYQCRINMGQQLAREHPVNADLVLGVPDSGTPAAIGFARESKIPYDDCLIKNRYVGRTFINPDQTIRDLGVKVKLNPIEECIVGKRVVVVDDSIVRGTTIKQIVGLIRSVGAKEVHLRVSSPPVISPCFYGIDTATKKELVAANNKVEEIARNSGADSLGYLSIQGMLAAINLPPRNFCLGCFNQEYPVEVPKDLLREKMVLRNLFG